MIGRKPIRPALWTRLVAWARAVDDAMDTDPMAQHAARLEHRVARLDAQIDDLTANGRSGEAR